MAKKLSLPHILFIFILFAFVLGEVVRIQLPSGVAIKALDIGVLLFVVTSMLHFRRKLTRPGLVRAILAFFSIAVFSLIFNFLNLKADELLTSSLYAVRWIAYAGVYFVIANLDSDLKKKIPNLLLIAGGLILSLGFIQYFLYPNLRNLYYLGWDEHLYRLFSTFLDPNFAGAFFVLYFLFVLGLFLKSKRLTYGVILALTFTAIVLTYSRSAYLMLFVGIITFFWVQGKKKLIVGFTLLFTLVIILASLLGFKSEGTNLLRTSSSFSRVDTAKNALIIFEKNPILGVGFNAYRFASEKYGFSKVSEYADHSVSGTDNSFLFVLATTGIVGLSAYLYLWYKILFFAKSNLRKNVFFSVLLSSSVALLFGSLFVNSLFYTFLTLWMWILLGFVED